MSLVGLSGSEWQPQDLAGRTERPLEQGGERLPGDSDLVGGHGEAAFGDMKNAMRGAAVAAGIVQDSLRHAVGIEVGRRKAVAAARQAHDARQPGAVEHEGMRRQAWRAFGTDVGQVRVEEVMDPGVGRAIEPFEHAVAYLVVFQQRPCQFEERLARFGFRRGFAEGDELEVDVADKILFTALP